MRCRSLIFLRELLNLECKDGPNKIFSADQAQPIIDAIGRSVMCSQPRPHGRFDNKRTVDPTGRSSELSITRASFCAHRVGNATLPRQSAPISEFVF